MEVTNEVANEAMEVVANLSNNTCLVNKIPCTVIKGGVTLIALAISTYVIVKITKVFRNRKFEKVVKEAMDRQDQEVAE